MPVSALWAGLLRMGSSLLPLHIEFAFVGWMIQLALVLINAGICLVCMDALVSSEVFTLVGRTSEILGLITFVIGKWRRVKAFET